MGKPQLKIFPAESRNTTKYSILKARSPVLWCIISVFSEAAGIQLNCTEISVEIRRMTKAIPPSELHQEIAKDNQTNQQPTIHVRTETKQKRYHNNIRNAVHSVAYWTYLCAIW